MLSRRAMMTLSIIFSIVLYAGFLFAAPHIMLINADASTQRVVKTFRVDLKNIPKAPPVEPKNGVKSPEKGETTQSGSGSDLVSRPGSMSELVARPDDQSMAGQGFQVGSAEIPNIVDRISSDSVPREHDLSVNESIAQGADAKIIEIARETARMDLSVPRRLVRPSPERILPPGDYPTFRSEASEPGQIPLELDRRGTSLFNQPIGMPGGGGQPGAVSGAPAAASLVAATPPPEPPPLPKEVTKSIDKPVVDVPVQKEVKVAREESDYMFLDDLVDIKINSYRPTDEKKGYFELTIIPKETDKIEVLPKDITFVLDASRSMMQRKLDLAARSLEGLIKKLRPEDHFNVVVFRDNPSLFQPVRVPATEENKNRAVGFLKGLEANGQTNVYAALEAVAAEQPRNGVPGIVLLVTDGRPTTGVQDSRAVINGVTAENNLRNTFFAFGAGNTVNRYLLDLLAYRNKGMSAVTPNIEETNAKLTSFFDGFNDPLLVNIKTDYGHIDRAEIFPRTLPDFYRKSAFKIYGRFDPEKDKEFVIRLTGRAANRDKELVFRAKLTDAAQGVANIASEWAFSKAYSIISDISAQGEKPELIGQLRELSSKFNIRTTYDQ